MAAPHGFACLMITTAARGPVELRHGCAGGVRVEEVVVRELLALDLVGGDAGPLSPG